MKKTIIFLAILFVFASAFTLVPVRTSSGATTITTSDNDGVVIHTGAASTYTLGTVSSGFSCTIINHGTGAITLSGAVTVANGRTTTTIPASRGEITPSNISNSLVLIYDGTNWRGR